MLTPCLDSSTSLVRCLIRFSLVLLAFLPALLADVRKLLAVTQGKEKTYAGTSNETPQGRAFLKKQLDGLMAEKAQYKEKKLALQQLQQELPNLQEDAEYHEPPAAAAAGEGNEACFFFMCTHAVFLGSSPPPRPSPSLPRCLRVSLAAALAGLWEDCRAPVDAGHHGG